MTKKKEEKVVSEEKFGKRQIVNSKRFKNDRDLLNAILQEDKNYTLKEVEEKIEKFKKGKV